MKGKTNLTITYRKFLGTDELYRMSLDSVQGSIGCIARVWGWSRGEGHVRLA